jgi:hypothetical protein
VDFSKSSASPVALENISAKGLALLMGKDSSIVAAKGDLMASISSALGRPVTSMMRSSWFIVEVPGKMGFPDKSSPRIQPTLHWSTPLV